MDKRGMISLEIKKEERTYIFLMPIGSPFGEAYDAAFEVLSEITKQSIEAAEKAKRKQDEDSEDKSIVE